MILRTDPMRPTELVGSTGIYVRAQSPQGIWVDADITELDYQSLRTWLRSRGGENEWAESVIYTLLGHPR